MTRSLVSYAKIATALVIFNLPISAQADEMAWSYTDVGDAQGELTVTEHHLALTTKANRGDPRRHEDRAFAYRQVEGDFEIVTTLERIDASRGDAQTFAGLWLTQTLEPTYGGFQRINPLWADDNSNSDAEAYAEHQRWEHDNFPMSLPIHLKLIRRGGFVGAYRSDDGVRWEPAMHATPRGLGYGCVLRDPEGPVYVGVFLATSRGAEATAEFTKPQVRADDYPVRSTYLGNVGPGGTDAWHMQRVAPGLAVDGQGRVYLASHHNEQGTATGIYQDGRRLGWLGWEWIRPVGPIALSRSHAYLATETGFQRINLDTRRRVGEGVKLFEQRDRTGIRGVAVTPDDRTLYVANARDQRIEVWATGGMQRRSVLIDNLPHVGALSVSPDGQTLWCAMDPPDGRVLGFDIETAAMIQELSEPDWLPVGLDIHDDRLYVADNGPDQQVKVYDLASGPPQLIHTIGREGGIRADPAGVPYPDAFVSLSGVGVDGAGNVYVSMFGPPLHRPEHEHSVSVTGLRSFSPDGTPRWQMHCHIDLETLAVDPDDPTVLYSPDERFAADWDFVPDLGLPPGHPDGLGGAFKWIGFHRTGHYFPGMTPHDTGWGTPYFCRVEGEKFLVIMHKNRQLMMAYSPQTPHGDQRLTPVFAWASRNFPDYPSHGPQGSEHWTWTDDNSNGSFDPGEFTDYDGASLGQPQSFDLAPDGTLRSAGITWLAESKPTLNEGGIPVWLPGPKEDAPTPFHTGGIDLIRYVPENDTLFLTGTTEQLPNTSRWRTASRVLARYSRWSSGNRQPDWTVELPFLAHRNNPTLTSGNTRYNPNIVSLNAFEDHVFLGQYSPSLLIVLDAKTGKEVMSNGEALRLMPGPEVLSLSTDLDRGPLAVNMLRRNNGEYIVLMQDDMFAKVTVLRWTPSR
ncbi:MAG: hypothetical protein AAF823_01035 [Planctomycetota bacterium]